MLGPRLIGAILITCGLIHGCNASLRASSSTAARRETSATLAERLDGKVISSVRAGTSKILVLSDKSPFDRTLIAEINAAGLHSAIGIYLVEIPVQSGLGLLTAAPRGSLKGSRIAAAPAGSSHSGDGAGTRGENPTVDGDGEAIRPTSAAGASRRGVHFEPDSRLAATMVYDVELGAGDALPSVAPNPQTPKAHRRLARARASAASTWGQRWLDADAKGDSPPFDEELENAQMRAKGLQHISDDEFTQYSDTADERRTRDEARKRGSGLAAEQRYWKHVVLGDLTAIGEAVSRSEARARSAIESPDSDAMGRPRGRTDQISDDDVSDWSDDTSDLESPPVPVIQPARPAPTLSSAVGVKSAAPTAMPVRVSARQSGPSDADMWIKAFANALAGAIPRLF